MKHHAKNIQKKHSKKKDKAYFASKSELLTWVSTTLDLEIKSIDETQTGAIFCQLLDAAHPGTVRMNKVNWKAKLETEYISNFKLFQQGLSNNNIEKPINIQRLAKGKTQELIELLQWLYGHHLSLRVDPNNYDANKIRNNNKFIFYGDKINNMNYINKNNLGFKDDISRSSAHSDNKDFIYAKNNFKKNNNINHLNANLRGDNYYTNFNFQNNNINFFNNKNKNLNGLKNSKNIRGKSEKISIKDSSRSYSISPSSTNDKKDTRTKEESYNKIKNSALNDKNININIEDFANSPFIIDEKPEENMKEINNINKSDEKLNSILFDGISTVDKENILELERHDPINIHDMKILIRKLRVSNIIFKTNLGSILNKVTKERDFYLNKLKDIEYLYYNPIITNTEENKKNILKSILTSQTDSTIIINEEGQACIKPMKNYSLFHENKKEENEDFLQTKRNSQNVMKINFVYSKDIKDNNLNDFDLKKENKNYDIQSSLKEIKKLINKTQPINSENNNKKINSGIFSLKNDIYESNNRNINMKKEKDNNCNHVTPSTKTAYYDISSHILNESLHIPNTENANPNINNIDLE